MPRASLIFKLPEEAEEHAAALRGLEYKGAIQEIDNFIRKRLKHEDLSEDAKEALGSVREEIHSHFPNGIYD